MKANKVIPENYVGIGKFTKLKFGRKLTKLTERTNASG